MYEIVLYKILFSISKVLEMNKTICGTSKVLEAYKILFIQFGSGLGLWHSTYSIGKVGRPVA